MSAKRKDKKGRVLRTGESQRKDLTYQYRYTDSGGKPSVAMHIEHHMQWAMKKYRKLHPDDPLPTITPHVLRHTFCTNMANAGMAIKDLQYLMGHSDADVTLNVYTHASYAHAEDITVPDKWKRANAWLRLHQIYTNWP